MFSIDDFSGDLVTSRRLRIEGDLSSGRRGRGKCSIAAITASVVGGLISNRGTKNAANAQKEAAQQASDTQLTASREANALQEKMFNRQIQLYNQDIARQEPIRQAGLTGQNRLLDVLGLGAKTKANGYGTTNGYGSANAKFEERDIKMDPGYQFRLQEGQKALERSAAARGGLFSGRAAKDLQSYGQGMASQEYGNAYNRAYGKFQDERNNLLQPLQSLAGLSQTAASSQGASTNAFGNQAAAYGNSMSNNLLNTGNAIAGNQQAAGNARASGYIGQANNINNAIGSAYNAFASNRAPTGWGNTQFGATVRGNLSGVDRSGDEYFRQ